jgi:hypothetical protein
MANKWMDHLKATMKKHPGMDLGEAMKAAKKTYKKHGGGLLDTAMPVNQETGPLVNTKGAVEGFLVKTGGRRRHRKTHKGGQLYGFGESGGTLSDGNGRMIPTGSVADAAATVPKTGGRRHRRHSRRHTRRR